MLQYLAENASEGNRSVLAAKDLSPFLKTGMTLAVTHSEGSFPVWRDFLKNDLDNWGYLIPELLQQQRFELIWPCGFTGFQVFVLYYYVTAGIMGGAGQFV